MNLEHFKAEPNPNDMHDANSHTQILYEFKNTPKMTKNGYQIRIDQIRVDAFFAPLQSWVRRANVTDKQISNLLKHELGHFDLAKEEARRLEIKMNREFKNKIIPNLGSNLEAAIMKVREILSSRFIELSEALTELQKKYDKETNHGTITPIQERYNQRFKKLRSFRTFS